MCGLAFKVKAMLELTRLTFKWSFLTYWTNSRRCSTWSSSPRVNDFHAAALFIELHLTHSCSSTVSLKMCLTGIRLKLNLELGWMGNLWISRWMTLDLTFSNITVLHVKCFSWGCCLNVSVCVLTPSARPASSVCPRSRLGGGWAASDEPPCGSPAAPPVFSGGNKRRRSTLETHHHLTSFDCCSFQLRTDGGDVRVHRSSPWCHRRHPVCWCPPSPSPRQTPRVSSLRTNAENTWHFS